MPKDRHIIKTKRRVILSLSFTELERLFNLDPKKKCKIEGINVPQDELDTVKIKMSGVELPIVYEGEKIRTVRLSVDKRRKYSELEGL